MWSMSLRLDGSRQPEIHTPCCCAISVLTEFSHDTAHAPLPAASLARVASSAMSSVSTAGEKKGRKSFSFFQRKKPDASLAPAAKNRIVSIKKTSFEMKLGVRFIGSKTSVCTIAEVSPNGPLAGKLSPRDVVVSINGIKPENHAKAAEMLRDAPAGTIKLEVKDAVPVARSATTILDVTVVEGKTPPSKTPPSTPPSALRQARSMSTPPSTPPSALRQARTLSSLPAGLPPAGLRPVVLPTVKTTPTCTTAVAPVDPMAAASLAPASTASARRAAAATAAPEPDRAVLLQSAPAADEYMVKLARSTTGSFIGVRLVQLSLRDHPSVAEIDPDGPAAHTGIVVGDTLLDVNGVDAREGFEELKRAGLATPDGAVLKLRRPAPPVAPSPFAEIMRPNVHPHHRPTSQHPTYHEQTGGRGFLSVLCCANRPNERNSLQKDQLNAIFGGG